MNLVSRNPIIQTFSLRTLFLTKELPMVKLANTNRLNQSLGEHFPLSHVVWAAMAKIGSKQFNPDKVAEDTRHSVDLKIEGMVNGHPFKQNVSSIVAFGKEVEKSSSINPQVPELVAYILSKLNSATKSRILDDIPQEFIDNENQLPVSDPFLVVEVKEMLKKLRQTKTVTARGPVRCEYWM